MKFTAVGDAIIGRRICDAFAGLEELTPIIQQGEVRFFNLETTLNAKGECFAGEHSGGTYLRTDKGVLEDLKKFGFNVTSFNNNHVMDYSFNGLLKTLEAVEESGLPRLAKDPSFLSDFLRRCSEWGTNFTRNEDGTLSLILA